MFISQVPDPNLPANWEDFVSISDKDSRNRDFPWFSLAIVNVMDQYGLAVDVLLQVIERKQTKN